MKVNFYISRDDKRTLDKKSLTSVGSVEMQIETGSSIYKPLLKIQKESLTQFASVNYMYVPMFDRYYFIDNIETEKGGLLLISGSCDVLNSFKSQIKTINTLIVRQEQEKDMSLQDSEFLTKTERTVSYKNFSSSPFSASAFGSDNNCIMLTVSGGA